MNRLDTATDRETAACPFAHVAAALSRDEVLVLEMPKRMVVQYGLTETGAPRLNLFYGAQEVNFDEPHLFAFGETFARQHRFAAAEALGWGSDLDWSEIRDCLLALIDAGILIRESDVRPSPLPALDRTRPSPLPPAATVEPASWADLEVITTSLAGRGVEAGWLELVVPVFRIAHMTLDADGRQIGEANVFPRPLRLDRPTEWMTCTYAGTRYLDPKPMNVTALKAMRAHWTEMMMAIAVIRDAYLARFPAVSNPMTIGEIERLATLVLSIPTWQLVKPDKPFTLGEMHPALSSLFRVTDGLRLVMHQMLFVPLGEPALPPSTAMSVDAILDYAERNFAFHSETGVCAGPRHFVRDFLEVLVDGKRPDAPAGFTFSAPVAAALAGVASAFDYGLAGLRAHAVLFLFWPRMARAYQDLADVVAGAQADNAALAGLHAVMQDHLVTAERSTYLGSETWRAEREAAYAEMIAACSTGLGEPEVTLASLLHAESRETAGALIDAVAVRLASAQDGFAQDVEAARAVAAVIADFARSTQALLRAASGLQLNINAMLGRTQPQRPFTAADIPVHLRLQGPKPGKRLPFLFDELGERFGVTLEISPAHIDLSEAAVEIRH